MTLGPVMSTKEEQALVERAGQGNREAFDTLVARSRKELESLVASRLGGRLRGKLERDDLLQETVARALESIGRFEWQGEGSFRRWLFGIAENVTREAARKLRRGPDLEAFPDMPGTDSSPSKHVRRSERFERLQEAIRRLSPDHRRVILLVRIEGLTIREVAERMERSVSSVKNLLLRAMRAMRETLPDTESLTLPPRRLESEEEDDDE